MMSRYALTAALLLCACHSTPSLAPTPQLTGNYQLDPKHASVVWRISHAGLSNYTARFDDISGALYFDARHPEQSRVDIRIDPASVNTGLPDFDKTIASDKRYFNAGKHPDIRFTSTALTLTGKNSADMTGNLVFRGMVHPVTLAVTFNGAGKSFGHPGGTLGFSATGSLSRSDFGLTYLKNFGIGDDITLHIETEFNEKK